MMRNHNNVFFLFCIVKLKLPLKNESNISLYFLYIFYKFSIEISVETGSGQLCCLLSGSSDLIEYAGKSARFALLKVEQMQPITRFAYTLIEQSLQNKNPNKQSCTPILEGIYFVIKHYSDLNWITCEMN